MGGIYILFPYLSQILSEGHLLLALFSFVHSNDKKTGPREWNPAQFEELQLQVLQIFNVKWYLSLNIMIPIVSMILLLKKHDP